MIPVLAHVDGQIPAPAGAPGAVLVPHRSRKGQGRPSGATGTRMRTEPSIRPARAMISDGWAKSRTRSSYPRPCAAVSTSAPPSPGDAQLRARVATASTPQRNAWVTPRISTARGPPVVGFGQGETQRLRCQRRQAPARERWGRKSSNARDGAASRMCCCGPVATILSHRRSCAGLRVCGWGCPLRRSRRTMSRCRRDRMITPTPTSSPPLGTSSTSHPIRTIALRQRQDHA